MSQDGFGKATQFLFTCNLAKLQLTLRSVIVVVRALPADAYNVRSGLRASHRILSSGMLQIESKEAGSQGANGSCCCPR